MAVDPIKPDEAQNAERILMAALTLFASKGYAGTSIREIVQEAQVTNPMVYYYFGNKEGLFHGLLDAMQADFHQRIYAGVADCETPEAFVKLLVSVEIEGFKEMPEAFRFIYSVLFGPPGSFPEHNMFEVHDAFESELQRSWKKLLPEDKQNIDIGFLFGLVHAWVMGALRDLDTATKAGTRDTYLETITDEGVAHLSSFFLRGVGLK